MPLAMPLPDAAALIDDYFFHAADAATPITRLLRCYIFCSR